MAKLDLTPLVIKAQQGDQTALNDLISACYQDLYYYAYKTAGSEDLAADVTQESCLEIITTLDKLREPGAFTVWARRIVYHRCAKYFRDNREVLLEENEDGETLLDRLPDENPGSLPEQIQEDKEFKQLMQQMLDSLPAQQRSALLLYYYEHLSVGQIAQIQNTTEGTVKSRLNYGRKAMKTQVEDYEKKTGVRLHSIAPLPLLLLFLFGQEKARVAGNVHYVQPVIRPAVAPSAAPAAAPAAGTVAGKVVAGIVAAALVVGGVIGGITVLGGKDGESGTSGSKENGKGHTHSYTVWEYDEENHWGICECGEEGKAQAHTYDGRTCTVCQSKTPSEGLQFSKMTDSYKVTGIGTCTDTDIVIPSTYEGLPVTQIGPWAFEHDLNITSVVIPNSVTRIENRAFWGCENLEQVKLPDSLLIIDEYAFWTLPKLKELVIPASVRTLGYFMACKTGITEFRVPDGVWKLEDGILYDCDHLKTLYLPASVTELGPGALHGCTALEDIYFDGTIEQWKQIKKPISIPMIGGGQVSMSFMDGAGDFIVHCTDGDLTKTDVF